MSEFSSSTGLNPEFVLRSVRALDPQNNSLYSQPDDISIARLFSDIFRPFARFNVSAKEWVVYDGTRWALDPGGMIAEKCAKLLARALVIYAADKDSPQYLTYVSHFGDRRRRVVILQDAREHGFVKQEDFDTQPHLFNCLNGVLDLRTFKLLPHDPELLLSKCAGVVFDPDARSDTFEQFLREVMSGDVEKAAYLQEVLGYALTGTAEREECYFVYGSTTRNGKSTLLDTIGVLFGDYGMSIQPETLAQQKDRNSRAASGDIARLNGCRFLRMSEPPKRMKLDVALLKTLTGRDRITARHLYEREFEFTPVFKLFINTNYLPLVTDDTLFSSGRVKVITFDRHFSEAEQDQGLKDRLKQPENLSSILNWLLEGLRRYQARGNRLLVPESVKTATQDYREKSDKLRCFITDCLIRMPGLNVSAKRVYEAYAQWCEENGFGCENKSNFFDDLRNKGMLADTGTVDGRTIHNVVCDFQLTEPDDGLTPFR